MIEASSCGRAYPAWMTEAAIHDFHSAVILRVAPLSVFMTKVLRVVSARDKSSMTEASNPASRSNLATTVGETTK